MFPDAGEKKHAPQAMHAYRSLLGPPERIRLSFSRPYSMNLPKHFQNLESSLGKDGEMDAAIASAAFTVFPIPFMLPWATRFSSDGALFAFPHVY